MRCTVQCSKHLQLLCPGGQPEQQVLPEKGHPARDGRKHRCALPDHHLHQAYSSTVGSHLHARWAIACIHAPACIIPSAGKVSSLSSGSIPGIEGASKRASGLDKIGPETLCSPLGCRRLDFIIFEVNAPAPQQARWTHRDMRAPLEALLRAPFSPSALLHLTLTRTAPPVAIRPAAAPISWSALERAISWQAL